MLRPKPLAEHSQTRLTAALEKKAGIVGYTFELQWTMIQKFSVLREATLMTPLSMIEFWAEWFEFSETMFFEALNGTKRNFSR